MLDQSAEQRALAFEKAFRSVIQKVTGKASLAFDEELLEQFGARQNLVKSYVYLNNPEYNRSKAQEAESERAQMLADGNGESLTKALALFGKDIAENLIQVSFSGSVLERKVQALGLPFWGGLRPELLLWVVYEKSSNRSLLSSSDNFHAESIVSASKEVGLPVFLPVGDLEDFSTIDVNEIWGLFPSAVDEASVRYKADLNLVAKVSQVNNVWQGAWAMNLGASLASGRVTESSYRAMWLALMRDLSSELSDRYSVLASTQTGSYKVRVSGVNTFSDYVQAREHLRSLSTVKAVVLESVDFDVLNFDLVLLGTPEQFDQQVAFGRKLQRDLSVPVMLGSERGAEPPFPTGETETRSSDGDSSVGQEQESVILYSASSATGLDSPSSAEASVKDTETLATQEIETRGNDAAEIRDQGTAKPPVAHYIWRSSL